MKDDAIARLSDQVMALTARMQVFAVFQSPEVNSQGHPIARVRFGD